MYYFWNGHQKIEVYPVDLRIKQLDMQGEEILTKDRVLLKFNFIAQYRVVDPITNYKEINNVDNQICILIQMILREYVGINYLEDLLENRIEIGRYVLEKVKKEERKYGIELLDAGIKDIKLAEMNGVENAVYREPVKKEKEPEFSVKEEVKTDIEDILKKEPGHMEEQEEEPEIIPDIITEESVKEEIEEEEEQEHEEEKEKFTEESASSILEELSKILAKNNKK